MVRVFVSASVFIVDRNTIQVFYCFMFFRLSVPAPGKARLRSDLLSVKLDVILYSVTYCHEILLCEPLKILLQKLSSGCTCFRAPPCPAGLDATSVAQLRRSLVSFTFRMQSRTVRMWVVEVPQPVAFLYACTLPSFVTFLLIWMIN